MIPPLNPGLVITSTASRITRDFHRWLQLIEKALHGPFVGVMASGSFTVLDGEYAIHADELILLGSEEATLYGDSVLVVV